jgi:hypothetical protein
MRSNQNSTTTTKSANRVVVNNGGKGSIIINKNTTDAELPKMKIDLATKNIDFDYKNVKRNSEGEITSLKISTKDNNGSKTSTAINGDDDEPIDQIIINLTL